VLAHYFEAAGLPTVCISLVRLHSEKIKSPRTLWVPFELGRPLGAPGDATFQHRVLTQALGLLERSDVPILKDFPEDAPVSSSAEEEGWACPINLPAPPRPFDADADVLDEIEFLQSWHDLAVQKRGRTATGSAQLTIEETVRFVAAWARGEHPESPVEGMSIVDQLRLCSEDLRAFYAEAATAQPGKNGLEADSSEIANWFWSETRGGNLLLTLAETCRQSDDNMITALGNFLLVPYDQNHRESLK